MNLADDPRVRVRSRSDVDGLVRSWIGVGLFPCAGFVVACALSAALIGLLFPKYEARALLDTPSVGIGEYRRMIMTYSSESALHDFLTATGQADWDVSQRLLQQSRSSVFWEKLARPIVAVSRKDSKELGELKEENAGLIGIDLRGDSSNPQSAERLVDIGSRYLSNALIRERLRAWIAAGLSDTSTRQRTLRADIARARLDIEATESRMADLKAIVARYPGSSKFDNRQLVSVAEGGDRFLPPVAQLVAAESSIAQLRESIVRNELKVRQLQLLGKFYAAADSQFRQDPRSDWLIASFMKSAVAAFADVAEDADWSREAKLRLEATLSGFVDTQRLFVVRNGASTELVTTRHPLRLAVIGFAAAVLLLSALAFVRTATGSQGERHSNVSRDDGFTEVEPCVAARA